jgi:hypothetical protein
MVTIIRIVTTGGNYHRTPLIGIIPSDRSEEAMSVQDQPWITAEERARLLQAQSDTRPGAAAYARAIAQTLAIDLS